MILFSTHKKIFLLTVFVGSISVVLFGLSTKGGASSPIKPEECCRCHFDTCNEGNVKRFVHSPVRENYCAKCHIKQAITLPKKELQTDKAAIQWFSKIYTLANEHWFELPENSEGRRLSIELKNKTRQIMSQEITIPPLGEIAPFPVPQANSKISDVKVQEVKQGVFISANITWHTDRICDTKLLYGQNNIQSNTDADPRWTRHHEMTITGLEKKKTYILAAASQDIFGNETTSLPITFSTHQFFASPDPEISKMVAEIEVTKQFFKANERIFISFSANQQVAMRLGFRAGDSTATGTDAAKLPRQHLALTDSYELTITRCLTCHPESKGKLSHPINVQPKRGMTIPDEFPTLSDGRLTCMSCHKAHAANNHYRLIRANRKDLCLGCHRNF